VKVEMSMASITFADVESAARRLRGRVRPTPLVHSPWLSRVSGSSVYLKLESLQVTSSFKPRGALNALTILRDERGSGVRVVTASAGNHGRAVAWAAEQLGLRAVVFTPRNAPAAKLDPIRAHGADLRADAEDYEESEQKAKAFARESGAEFVSPYSHPDVIAGAGTVGLELLHDLPDLDVVLVPIGGGGLISGIATAVKGLRPGTAVVGVEAAASSAFHAARAAGHLLRIDVGDTIADGLGGNVDPDTLTWPIIRDVVDDVVVVNEEELRRGIRELMASEHLVAEGAGIAAVAAIAAGRIDVAHRTVAPILSGANIDNRRLAAILTE
jgi:threonine dehydratase